jgi:hypothetical protein
MSKPLQHFFRRVAAILAGISIVICGIFLILWPISYMTGVQFSLRNGAGVRYALLTTPGKVGWAHIRGEPRAEPDLNLCSKHFGGDAAVSGGGDPLRWFWQPPVHTAFGFGSIGGTAPIWFEEVKKSFLCDYWIDFAPIWLVPVITFLGPMSWWLRRKRREFRQDHGLCVYCGGDMSASPYRCPSCGKEPAW